MKEGFAAESKYHIYQLVPFIRKPVDNSQKIGQDFPVEIFRVSKEKEEKQHGE
jgi:hypothetical protein